MAEKIFTFTYYFYTLPLFISLIIFLYKVDVRFKKLCFFVVVALSIICLDYWGARKEVSTAWAIESIDNNIRKNVTLLEDNSQYFTKEDYIRWMEQDAKRFSFSDMAVNKIAKVFESTGFSSKASEYYFKAYALEPKAEYLLSALFQHSIANSGKMDQDKRILALRQYSIDSNLGLANILALDDFLHENYAAAIPLWQQALKDPNMELGMRNKIARAQEIALSNLTAADRDELLLWEFTPLVSDLGTNINSHPIAFIAIRDASSKPPIIAKKLSSNQLENKITLFRGDEMLPGASLIDFNNIKVTIIMAKTGESFESSPLRWESDIIAVNELPKQVFFTKLNK